ncbi:MAG TPA: protein kinase [Elusimicrobiota bacterium]|nr:protein kinase [Elusimicrobiota bacterium]
MGRVLVGRAAAAALLVLTLGAAQSAKNVEPQPVSSEEVQNLPDFAKLRPTQQADIQDAVSHLNDAMANYSAVLHSDQHSEMQVSQALGNLQLSYSALSQIDWHIAHEVLALMLPAPNGQQGHGGHQAAQGGGSSASDGAAPDGPSGADFYRGLARALPDEPEVRERLAQRLYDDGDSRGAADQAGAAIQLDPSRSTAYQLRASARMQLGDYAGAAADARKVMEYNPGNTVAASILRLTAGRAGAEAAPPPAPDGTSLASLSAASPSPEARDAVVPAASAAQRSRSMRGVRDSEANLAIGRPAEAVRQATKALQEDPANAAAFFARARAHMQSRSFDAALADIGEAVRLNPRSERYRIVQAKLLNRLGRSEEARAAALALLNLNGRSAEGRYYLAWALVGSGRRTEALRELEYAARLNGAYSRVYREALRLPSDADLAGVFLAAEDAPALDSLAIAPAAPQERGFRGGLWYPIYAFVGLALGLAWVIQSRPRRGPGAFTRWRRLHDGHPKVGVVPRSPQMTDSTGTLLGGRYGVVRRIGQGASGTVYEAVDRGLDRKVAVKRIREELRADGRERAAILREARDLAALSHPHVVELYEALEEDGELYLVSRLVPGGGLAAALESGPQPLEKVLRWARGVCAALDYAHGRGIAHRGVKPANILIDAEGQGHLADFGVGWRVQESLARLASGAVPEGPRAYQAPEQEQGLPCPASDVFALAVCVYEALAGRRPFPDEGARRLMAKLSADFAPASSLARLPPGVDAALARGLAPEPGRRPRSAGEFFAMFSH